MPYTAKINLPPDTPKIWLCVRMIDNVPVLFTSRGEYVSGQKRVVVNSSSDEAVTVESTILVERDCERLPGVLQP